MSDGPDGPDDPRPWPLGPNGAPTVASSAAPARRHARPPSPLRLIGGTVLGLVALAAVVVGLVGWFRSPPPPSLALPVPPSHSAAATPLPPPPSPVLAATAATASPGTAPGGVTSSPRSAVVPAPGASGGASAAPTGAAAGSPSPPPTPSSGPASPTAAPPAAVTAPVAVYNATIYRGLASTVAARLSADGWPVVAVGNWLGGQIPLTTVYYPPGMQSAAAALAQVLPATRVRPAVTGMPSGDLTVVLLGDVLG